MNGRACCPGLCIWVLLWYSYPHGPEFQWVKKLLAYIALFNLSHSHTWREGTAMTFVLGHTNTR